MRTIKTILVIFLAMMALTLSGPNTGTAASVELELPIQTALDKVSESKDSTFKSNVKTLTTSLLTLQEQNKAWDLKIIDIHATNDEALLRLQQQIKEIDLVKIDQLTTTLEKTKDRYRPIIDAVTPLSTLLGSKMKIAWAAVQLARADIEMKQSALNKAKSAKATTVRTIRATLAEANAYKAQIKSAKSSIALQKTRITAAGKSFNSAVKKADMKSALDYLTNIAILSRQIAEQKQKILITEKIISSILIKAKAQVPFNR